MFQTKHSSLLTAGLLAAVVAGFSGRAEAAVITWQVGPNFSGSTGFQAISTNGSLVEAVNLANPADGPLTVDPSGLNITFTATDAKLNQGAFGSGSPGSTDAAWNSIINSTDWAGGSPLIPNFFSGLTVGQQYQVQLFASDTRGGGDSAATLSFRDEFNNFSPGVVAGSFTSVLGTFTANATTQTLGVSSSTNAILNAYVLRAVPEPASLGLLAAGAVMMLTSTRSVRGRRRRD
jgi:hypothetical protein